MKYLSSQKILRQMSELARAVSVEKTYGPNGPIRKTALIIYAEVGILLPWEGQEIVSPGPQGPGWASESVGKIVFNTYTPWMTSTYCRDLALVWGPILVPQQYQHKIAAADALLTHLEIRLQAENQRVWYREYTQDKNRSSQLHKLPVTSVNFLRVTPPPVVQDQPAPVVEPTRHNDSLWPTGNHPRQVIMGAPGKKK
jgi:hypothetical protein